MSEIGLKDRALRAKEAAHLIGVSRSTWWRWARDGKLPTPTHLGPRVTIWMQSQLESWLANHAAGGQS